MLTPNPGIGARPPKTTLPAHLEKWTKGFHSCATLPLVLGGRAIEPRGCVVVATSPITFVRIAHVATRSTDGCRGLGKKGFWQRQRVSRGRWVTTNVMVRQFDTERTERLGCPQQRVQLSAGGWMEGGWGLCESTVASAQSQRTANTVERTRTHLHATGV